jgi:hypothetical protein
MRAHYAFNSFKGQLNIGGADRPEEIEAYQRALRLGDFEDQTIEGLHLNSAAPAWPIPQMTDCILLPHGLYTITNGCLERVKLNELQEPLQHGIAMKDELSADHWRPLYCRDYLVFLTLAKGQPAVFDLSGKFLGYSRLPEGQLWDTSVVGPCAATRMMAGCAAGVLPEWSKQLFEPDLQAMPADSRMLIRIWQPYTIQHQSKNWRVENVWAVSAMTQDTLYFIRATEGKWAKTYGPGGRVFTPSRYAVVSIDMETGKELFARDCGNRDFSKGTVVGKRISVLVDSEYAYILLPKAGRDSTPVEGLRAPEDRNLLIDKLWGDGDVLIVQRRTGEIVQ